jgi:dTDP-4-dehydrorhamnose 3,5-epimerase
MKVVEAEISDIKLLKPVRHVDSRGFFSEVFKEDVLREHGIDIHFVQDNHSLSASKGVVRGLHFQIPPFAQAKLLRVTAGSIFDVAVDIRWGSPSFGRHVAVVLSASDWNQIFIPEGFAHGYCTLEPDTEVIYKVSAYYSPEHDRGLLWSDPALGIAWPVAADEVLVSDRDCKHPILSELPRFFRHEPAVARATSLGGNPPSQPERNAGSLEESLSVRLRAADRIATR